MLDMEDKTDKKGNIIKSWTPSKDNNDLWISTFISVLKNANYNTILYGNKGFYDFKTSNKFGSQPLWHAAYPTAPKHSPEWDKPIIANGWSDWTLWQFSSSNEKLDLNLMRKDFFDSPKLT